MELGPRDIFLAAYLPYVVETHFLVLEILVTAEKHVAGPAADVVQAELATLPLRGPEIVSAVLELEDILRAAGRDPPPPPRALSELPPWRTALLEVTRPYCVPTEPTDANVSMSLRANGALYSGRALGDAEQTLRLQVLTGKLRALQQGEPWLEAQHENLERARVGVLVHLRDLVAEGSVKLARPLGPIAFDALGDALGKVEAATDMARRAEAWSAVGRDARAVEACMLLPRASDALADARARGLAWAAALRPMLQAPGWTVPCDLAGAPPAPVAHVTQEGAKRVMRAFTDDAALAATGFAGTHLTTLAWAVLQQVDARADEVVIDPGTAHETRIAKPDLARLQHLCFSARIEGVVRDFSALDVGALRAFEEYRVLYGEDRVHHLPATDRAGRQHAAVFTAEDALTAFIANHPAPSGAKVGSIPGAKLFPMLLTANAPGIVFNPAGPTRPRWFTRSFLERIAH